MGSGGSRGLQNRCFGAEASKGWFDSDTPPPNIVGRTCGAPWRGVPWRAATVPYTRSAAAPYSAQSNCALLHGLGEESHLLCARLVCNVHGRDRLFERHLVFGIHEDDAIGRRRP